MINHLLTLLKVFILHEGKDNSFLSEFGAHCTDEGISSVINENDFLDSTDISDNNSINSDFDNKDNSILCHKLVMI